jgi:hypothetical protein
MKTKKCIKLYISIVSYLGDRGFLHTYKGTNLKSILYQIMDNHSYGQPRDKFDKIILLQNITVKEICEEIDKNNGDGCDFIVSIISSKGKLIYKFQ